MDEASIRQYITETFDGVESMDAMGYTFFFYGPDRKMPFATLANQDNEHDLVSNLDRPSVYRLNIGVSKDTYRVLFPPAPSQPGEVGNVEADHDFTALDKIMPHPVYAAQYWVCVLSPGEKTIDTVRSLLAEAHDLAVRRRAKSE